MITIEIPYMDESVIVTFTYNKGFAGNLEEPPEDPDIDIEEIKHNGADVSGIVDWDIIEELIWEYLNNEKDRY